jgi:hypothetical protein
MTSTEAFCKDCRRWVVTYAFELTDFKPVTDKVTLKYKVLEYHLE